MIFVINNLKYDTTKMELISIKNVKIFKSLKNHWLLTYETDYKNCAVALSEEEAKKYLMHYDLEAYEKFFGAIGGSVND